MKKAKGGGLLFPSRRFCLSHELIVRFVLMFLGITYSVGRGQCCRRAFASPSIGRGAFSPFAISRCSYHPSSSAFYSSNDSESRVHGRGQKVLKFKQEKEKQISPAAPSTQTIVKQKEKG
jgi:hypothetical protein